MDWVERKGSDGSTNSSKKKRKTTIYNVFTKVNIT